MAETTMQDVPMRTEAAAMGAPDGAMPADATPADSAMQSEGGMQQATPEQQEQYDKIVGNAMLTIYSEKSFPAIVDALRGDGNDPKAALARTSATLVGRVAMSALQAGQKLTGDVLLHAGTEIFEELAHVATKAGIHDFDNDPDAMEGSLFMAMDLFREGMQQSGLLKPEMAQQDMAKLQAMDESGELETMFRAMAKNDRSGQAEEPVQRGNGLMASAEAM